MQTRIKAVKGDTSFPWLTHLMQEADSCSLGMRGLADWCFKEKMNFAWTQDGLALPMFVSESY